MASVVTLSAFLRATKRQSDAALRVALAKLEHRIRPTSRAMAQALRGARPLILGGKRLRPALVAAGYVAAGKKLDRRIIQAGVAVELLHAFALVHDDIIDASAERRGVATVHTARAKAAQREGRARPTVVGVNQAILIGDLLVSVADEVFNHSGFHKLPIVRGRHLFHALRTELMAGQYEDVELGLSLRRATPARVLHVMSVKSGHYTIALPLLLGATLGNARSEILKGLRAFAEPAGIAFQLQDDLLGTFGSAAVGKPTDSDIREGKATLLAVHALRHASTAQRQFLLQTLGNPWASAAAVQRIRKLFLQLGSAAFCQKKIQAYATQARRTVQAAAFSSQTQTLLTGLVQFLLERKK